MILFTSVTKKTFGKACLTYLGIAIFCLLFTYIYEQFSYGESSYYMRLMFLAPLMGAILSLVSGFGLTWVRTRFSLLLLNSSIAVVVSGCLIKGIIYISGRSITYELYYWLVSIGFLALSLIMGLFGGKSKRQSINRSYQMTEKTKKI